MTTTITVETIRTLGHDGRCDLDAGCNKPAVVAVAEATNPACHSGDAATAFYCAQHVDAAPQADLADVQRAAHVYDGPIWSALLANYPDPVRIA
jgi:hypothetical protein